MQIPPIIIQTASVKVMRSYDYCHFEINLSTSGELLSVKEVDNLRKEAARLADKAVEQYKVAKAVAEAKTSAESCVYYNGNRIAELKNISESERTPEQKAQIKAYDDEQFRARRTYDYQDDFETDYSEND